MFSMHRAYNVIKNKSIRKKTFRSRRKSQEAFTRKHFTSRKDFTFGEEK
jgi:hypothetical protein